MPAGMGSQTAFDTFVVVAFALLFTVSAYTVRLVVRFEGRPPVAFDELRGGLAEVRADLRALGQELREHDSDLAALAREVFRRRDEDG